MGEGSSERYGRLGEGWPDENKGGRPKMGGSLEGVGRHKRGWKMEVVSRRLNSRVGGQEKRLGC